jgi:hypothetical protein
LWGFRGIEVVSALDALRDSTELVEVERSR